jgi:hypothetical protein
MPTAKLRTESKKGDITLKKKRQQLEIILNIEKIIQNLLVLFLQK